MLEYVLWHQPAAGIDKARYEAALSAFHEALQLASPLGFERSRAYRVQDVPWLPGGRGYEDWYNVADFTALGQLNEAAIAARLRPAHDEAASLAGYGSAGVYELIDEATSELPALTACLWLSKASGYDYETFKAQFGDQFGDAVEIHQRQMTLGPASEFCVAGGRALASRDVPPTWKAQMTLRTQVWP